MGSIPFTRSISITPRPQPASLQPYFAAAFP